MEEAGHPLECPVAFAALMHGLKEHSYYWVGLSVIGRTNLAAAEEGGLAVDEHAIVVVGDAAVVVVSASRVLRVSFEPRDRV